MNARVFLLILVTGLFMAAWNGDETAMQAAIARRSERQAQAIAAAAMEEDNVHVADHAPVKQPLQTVSVTMNEAQADVTTTSAVPLPREIAAGTYQAVDQTGTSIRVDVDKSSDAPARDFYMVDAEDGNRWYLIRVTR